LRCWEGRTAQPDSDADSDADADSDSDSDSHSDSDADADSDTGGHRTERYDTAMGSARECRALLQAAIAAGYLANNECELPLELIDKIVATLWRCTHGR
jgi:hypothetical protein